MTEFKKPSKQVFVTLLSAGAVVFVLACIGVGILIANISQTATIEQGTSPNAPDFQSVLPEGKDIDSLGGWQKLIAPGGETFYTFLDSLDSVPISVSQQELPASFKDTVDSSVADVAKGYSATDTFTVEDTKAYIGVSAKGQQSVIFTKNDLLILINSQSKIEVDTWKSYIKSLD